MLRKCTPAYITEKDIFAEKLRERMRECSENQSSLAQKIGVQRQTISLYTTGQSKPDTEKLSKIAQALNVSSDWLLGLSDVKTPDVSVKAICEKTGLSEKAVTSIMKIKGLADIGGFIGVNELTGINDFLSTDNFIFCAGEYAKAKRCVLSQLESFDVNGSDDYPLDDTDVQEITLRGFYVCEYMYHKIFSELEQMMKYESGYVRLEGLVNKRHMQRSMDELRKSEFEHTLSDSEAAQNGEHQEN